MATVRENIKNALTWFYDRLKNKYLDPFDQRISDNATDISGKAPISHASSNTTYGVGTTSNYGHCMTINNLTTSSHTNGYALSAYQGYLLNSRVGSHSTYTGNIDDLHGSDNAGGYWCHADDCSGDQPFSGTYYYLDVGYANDGRVQRAVRYSNGDIKYRCWTNSKWYDWGISPDELNTNMNSIISVSRYSLSSVTIDSSSTYVYELSTSNYARSGYTLVAIVGWRTSTSSGMCYRAEITDNTIYFAIRNINTSSSITVAPNIDLLYTKNF